MSDVVHLLWFAEEMPEGEDDIELLIGVYSSNEEARAAIQRMKDKPGFADSPQCFEVCPYSLDHDHWTDGFVLDGKRALPRWLGLRANNATDYGHNSKLPSSSGTSVQTSSEKK